jgi:BRCA1-associated protein
MMSSKLDAVALEYNQLLTSQLESQRQYFEGLIAGARAEAERSRAEAERCGSVCCGVAAHG